MTENKRSPAQINEDLEAALQGTADIDTVAVIFEIVDDALDSMSLALKEAGVAQEVIDAALEVTNDYLGNHY